jgi:NAD(P)-dependent dehydrogenase (short-subunit alcohol dehydrogenase family)
MNRLASKVAVITGGAVGLGRAMAVRMAGSMGQQEAWSVLAKQEGPGGSAEDRFAQT